MAFGFLTLACASSQPSQANVARDDEYRQIVETVTATMNPATVKGCESKGLVHPPSGVTAISQSQATMWARHDAGVLGGNVVLLQPAITVPLTDRERSIGMSGPGYEVSGEAYLCPTP